MITMYLPFIALISFCIATIRVIGVTHVAFQAVAHIWVGILIGGWWLLPSLNEDRWHFRLNVIVLSIVEIIAAGVTFLSR